MNVVKAVKVVFLSLISLCSVMAMSARADNPTPNVKGIWAASAGLTIEIDFFKNHSVPMKSTIFAPNKTGECEEGKECSYNVLEIVSHGVYIDPNQCRDYSSGKFVNPTTNNPDRPSFLIITVDKNNCTVSYK